MTDFYKYLMEAVLAGKVDKEVAVRLLKMVKSDGRAATDGIAVVGMALNFPGAQNPDEFWNLVAGGADCVRPFPPLRRRDADAYLDATSEPQDGRQYHRAAFLDEVDRFDYRTFRLTPKEAALMDPGQRLFLQTAWHALEDAGYGGGKLSGSRTGVFVGYATYIYENYARMILDVDPTLMETGMVGNIPALMPSRISYLLNLKGPAVLLDTACSSSLVAVQTACQAIKKGDCDLALAGGVRLSLVPAIRDYLKLGVESGDSRTRSFDEHSTGSGMGEGVAAILLKPLEAAIRDGDQIYAVIRGGATNQDGSTMSITAPNPAAQEEVLVQAWKEAGIKPETISYIEAHGTGTRLGDPIEFLGLERAFARYTDRKQFCAIGTVKTNIGHLNECAGMAGLIKALLALRHQQLPPSVNFQRPSSRIGFDDSPVYVNTRLRSWEAGAEPRLCGVSAFGLSGTNCHIVLEEYVPPAPPPVDEAGGYIVPVSARSREALLELVGAYGDFLDRNGCNGRLIDFAATAAAGRGHYEHRIALIVRDLPDLHAQLKGIVTSGLPTGEDSVVYYGHCKVVRAEKGARARGELTEGEKADLTRRAEALAALNSGNGNAGVTAELCRLYVAGADVQWDGLYAGHLARKISLPGYPFERNRCWLDLPGETAVPATESGVYFEQQWRQLALPDATQAGGGAPGRQLLLLRPAGCHEALGAEVVTRLRAEGLHVVQGVTGCARFEQQSTHVYTLGDHEEHYAQLLQKLAATEPVSVIYLAGPERDAMTDLVRLQASQRTGPYALFCLGRSTAGWAAAVDVMVVARNVQRVSGQEEALNPAAAPAFGFSKVLPKEFAHVQCRRVDMDPGSTAADLIDEWKHGRLSRDVAYRGGARYEAEFAMLDMGSAAARPWHVREDGVYLISGGTGGIGLEVGRYLASLGRVKLALVNRTGLPDRSQWDLIAAQPAHKLHRKVTTLRELEALGITVDLYRGDVGDLAHMEQIAGELRAKYGRINGVIHAAGVARDELVTERQPDGFHWDVVAPKVYGAWVLDQITRVDDPDLFLLFSSVATLFATQRQSEYVAANAFLDAFAAWRSLQGRPTLTINWTTWKETGMAHDHGFTVDTIFKAMQPEVAVKRFAPLLTKGVAQVLIGELNTEGGGMHLLERAGLRLAPAIRQRIDEGRLQPRHVARPSRVGGGDLRLAGRDDSGYTVVERALGGICHDILGLADIDLHDNFFEMGADSVLLMRIHARVESLYPGQVAVTDMFEYPSLFRLAAHISRRAGTGLAVQGSDLAAAGALEGGGPEGEGGQDIAVIGIGSLLPSSANLAEFWEQVCSGADLTGKFPDARMPDLERYLAFKGFGDGTVIYNPGAYLERIDTFDAAFFRIPPREATLMDPTHRLALMNAWQAVEDAGYGGGRLAGTSTGVYIGFASHVRDMYSRILYEVDPAMLVDGELGNTPAVLSGRISYLLDLKGPSLVVDTACSSSLTAIHFAVQALKRGECDMALAGGIKVATMPITLTSANSGMGMAAADGKTRSFDHESDGTATGEGVITLLLKPLRAALRDRDNIHAVIKGTASNQDGQSAGLSAPNPAAQEEVISRAWADAAVHPESITYIEAHGTGTQLGDPIETKSLSAAFARLTRRQGFCAVSSVKTNIGHLSEGAGMAGVLKAILALKHRQLPPSLYFERPNAKIDFVKSALYVNTRLQPWESQGGPLRCGVSAFGVSGTNCHVVLEEAPIVECPSTGGVQVLALSARTAASLKVLLQSYLDQALHENITSLADLCYTANTGRDHYQHRLALIATGPDDLRTKLSSLCCMDPEVAQAPWMAYGYHRLVADDRVHRAPGQLTRAAKAELDGKAVQLSRAFADSGKRDAAVLREICGVYASGAEVPWEALYQGEQRRKVSLPTYPFEGTRYWVDVPEPGGASAGEGAPRDGALYHVMGWRAEEAGLVRRSLAGQRGLVLTAAAGGDHPVARELAGALRHEGMAVVEGLLSGEADYRELLERCGPADRLSIFHLASLSPAGLTDAADLQDAQARGMLSLYQLVRALLQQNVVKAAEIVLVAERVYEVTGGESALNPQYATLLGLGKVVGQEYPNLQVRCVDLDEFAGVGDILAEASAGDGMYHVAYREGRRYVEELREVAPEATEEPAVAIREGGLYLITGGTGGIGLAMARHLAAKQRVRLALVSRTGLPPRAEWHRVLALGADEPLCAKLRAVQEIERLGSEVHLFRANVSREDQLRPVVEALRQRFGRIDGVLHCAGVAGASILLRKELDQFLEVVNPKVTGTWLLDKLTEPDAPDFFVLFSSAATLTGEAGMGDYVAANCFQDAYSAYRSRRGGRTITLNWVSWRDAGMAVAFGVNVDGIFKALPTAVAVQAFDQAVGSALTRVIVGELNPSWFAQMASVAELLPCRLSESLSRKLNRQQSSPERPPVALVEHGRMSFLPRSTMSRVRQSTSHRPVMMKGKGDQEYSAIEQRLAAIYSAVLGFTEINVYDSFFELGGDSILLGRVYTQVEAAFPGVVRLTDLFEHTSVAKLASHIQSSRSEAPPRSVRTESAELKSADIAIIGIALKMPDIDSLDGLWDVVCGGADCIGAFPQSRRADMDGYVELLRRGMSAGDTFAGGDGRYAAGAYLDDVAGFDHKLFRMSPKEAALLDPSQRAFLEVTWRALEDAGYSGRTEGSRTGVYVGYAANPTYQRMLFDIDPELLGQSLVGTIAAMMPGRVAHLLDLKGPSMVVDTACSSSLVAIHLASQALRMGECDMAIAGGVRLHILPLDTPALKVGFEAPEGYTRTFDNAAAGAGAGEGVAAVILKPLAQAVQDGDNIYAVIRGTATNQDGRSMTLTAPNPSAQADVITEAWSNAGIDPATLSYIEAHGTATGLGDPIEVSALKKAFGRYTGRKQFCAIGSVKANLGHLYEAAGMAGLLKALLVIRKRQIPPAVHFQRPNGKIDFCDSAVYVNTAPRQIMSEQPVRCGISAFGLSGTNTHLVLEEYLPEPRGASEGETGACQFVALSAHSAESLLQLIRHYRDHVQQNAGGLRLADLAGTAATGRCHFEHRIALLVQDMTDLRGQLERLSERGFSLLEAPAYYGKHKVVHEEKKIRAAWEITHREKAQRNRHAADAVERWVGGGGNAAAAALLCQLYVSGADVEWTQVYPAGAFERISLPGYPFERQRCWVEIPARGAVPASEDDAYFGRRWRVAPLAGDSLPEAGEPAETVLLVRPADSGGGWAGDLADQLRGRNLRLVEVQLGGAGFAQLCDDAYLLRGEEDDWRRLLDLFAPDARLTMFFLAAPGRTPCSSLQELRESQETGVYALYGLARATAARAGRLDLLLVANGVHAVTGREADLNPAAATAYGFAQVLDKEFPQVRCRRIDGDVTMGSSELVREWLLGQASPVVAYRGGARYEPELAPYDLEAAPDRPLAIRPDGVYLIAGGVGGIGLELARYLAAHGAGQIALISRSGMPDRGEWRAITARPDHPQYRKINTILAVESLGAQLDVRQADVADAARMADLVGELRTSYGRINGVIHAAGVSRDQPLAERGAGAFAWDIFAPKVYGAWVLDQLTRSDDLDFFLLCSSVATFLPAVGQSEYVAANAFLDAFAAWRSLQGRQTASINWTTWKETGMSFDHGFTVDTTFKALPTASAIKRFDRILTKAVTQVLVGELNDEGGGIYLLERSRVGLSTEIRQRIDRHRQRRHRAAASGAEKTASPAAPGRALGSGSARNQVEQTLSEICCDMLSIDAIDMYDNFFELGADSVLLTRICQRVQTAYPGRIVMTDLFEYPSIHRLADRIVHQAAEQAGREEYGQADAPARTAIAIIGMSAMLPSSSSMAEFWANIRSGADLTGKLPEARKADIDRYLAFRGITADAVDYVDGAYLSEIDKFDHGFFRLSPREAALMDPNHRLALTAAWQSVEDAGYGGGKIAGTNTAVYFGFASPIRDMYSRILYEAEPESLAAAELGNTPAVLPGRISYLLNLKGPSMVVDTACSSSLMAVHLAVQALKRGECDMALAGGIKVTTLPVRVRAWQNGIGMSSADGKTRSFDAGADGTAMGEGVVSVLLKPLHAALRDGDQIHAVIRGSSANQDGTSAGLTAPNPAAQRAVITSAWEDAGVTPETVTYVEAHGTATPMGDPIEITALHQAFASQTAKRSFCAIASVKTNVGHLSECAGLAGLLKAVLALKHQMLPPTLHFQRPNAGIDLVDSALFVNARLQPWHSNGHPRRSGVSAFGLGGTNCHVILEEAPDTPQNQSTAAPGPHVLALSARSRGALKQLVRAYVEDADTLTQVPLADLCFTANTGRGHYAHRLAITASDTGALLTKLQALYDTDMVLSERIGAADGNHAKGEMDQQAATLIGAFVASGRQAAHLLDELCHLYARGADIAWEELFHGLSCCKVSLPTYPFEGTRCWIDLPEADTKAVSSVERPIVDGLFYAMGWRPGETPRNKRPQRGEHVLLLTGGGGCEHPLSGEVAALLRREGLHVVATPVPEGESPAAVEHEYRMLLEGCGRIERLHIIHVAALQAGGGMTVERDLHDAQRRGMFSLYHLGRALQQQTAVRQTNLLLVAERVCEVTGHESGLNPEYATLFGLGKVVGQEYPGLRVRCVDVDEATAAADLRAEMAADDRFYHVAYRDGVRYEQELREADVPEAGGQLPLQEGGIYLVTGGTGGIGLALARHLACKARVRIALVSRTGLPERTEWDRILAEGADELVCAQLQAVREIERSGSEVFAFRADVAREAQLRPVIEAIRTQHGRINGVIHCAGVAAPGVLARRELDQFLAVVGPKVYGTWLLDRLTEPDAPDFFVLCSSVVTLTGEASQGDYVAANSFLDAYSAYRNRGRGRTLTINWVSWRDAGMAVTFGVNVDAVFRTLPTQAAVAAFDLALTSPLTRVIIGQLNPDWHAPLATVAHLLPYRLSDNLNQAVKQVIDRMDGRDRPGGQVAVVDAGGMTFLPMSTMAKLNRGGRHSTVSLRGKDGGTYSDVEDKLATIFGTVLGYPEINVADSFFELGGDSILLGRVHALVDQEFPGAVRLIDLFEYTSVARLAAFMQGSGVAQAANPSIPGAVDRQSGDIAIIGMDFRLPGAESAEELWEVLRSGSDSVRRFPPARRADTDRYADFLKQRLGDSSGVTAGDGRYGVGGYLDDVAGFDYRLFRISPREAALMEPAQRAFLGVSWRAIEDAGYGGRIEGSRTGVWVGYAGNSAYQRMIYDVAPSLLGDSMIGNIAAMMPSRIAHLLDLKGPGMVVDAACSSSLVAVHLACQALRAGECDMAIAGGVRLDLLPLSMDSLKIGYESADGNTRSFDEAGDGTGAAEGVAAVLLKPLEQALRDGDRVHAVIKGSAVNHHGRSMLLTAPNRSAQTEVIHAAWHNAGIDPEVLCYVEANGTASRLGDPLEIDALRHAFARHTSRRQFCAVGSIKPNIGHLNECAGIAGLLKAVLVLKHREIPPAVHFRRPNNLIDFCESPLYVSTLPHPVEAGGRPLLCGVNSFGISGTNCHVVLEEYVAPDRGEAAPAGGPQILALSAKTQTALVELAHRYRRMAVDSAPGDLPRICYTGSTGRAHLPCRLSLVVRSLGELKQKLDEFIAQNDRGSNQ